ncbi:hypothetical protein J6590_072042 [Homalodisca vitripennis]|nr:hypothetical protein J6590_072042 [Homalodisca vitripennis]
MKKCNARGSTARDPHGIKQITVGPPHGIKQITMFIRENVECLDSSFTTTTTIKDRFKQNKGDSRYSVRLMVLIKSATVTDRNRTCAISNSDSKSNVRPLGHRHSQSRSSY